MRTLKSYAIHGTQKSLNKSWKIISQKGFAVIALQIAPEPSMKHLCLMLNSENAMDQQSEEQTLSVT